jgi:hypothetical protein
VSSELVSKALAPAFEQSDVHSFFRIDIALGLQCDSQRIVVLAHLYELCAEMNQPLLEILVYFAGHVFEKKIYSPRMSDAWIRSKRQRALLPVPTQEEYLRHCVAVIKYMRTKAKIREEQLERSAKLRTDVIEQLMAAQNRIEELTKNVELLEDAMKLRDSLIQCIPPECHVLVRQMQQAIKRE